MEGVTLTSIRLYFPETGRMLWGFMAQLWKNFYFLLRGLRTTMGQFNLSHIGNWTHDLCGLRKLHGTSRCFHPPQPLAKLANPFTGTVFFARTNAHCSHFWEAGLQQGRIEQGCKFELVGVRQGKLWVISGHTFQSQRPSCSIIPLYSFKWSKHCGIVFKIKT